MDTATRRGRGKEGEDLKNNGTKNLYIHLSQILPLFLVLLSGKWLQSGRHKGTGFPLLRECDINVSFFSFLLSLVFHFFLFLNSDESIFMFADVFLHFTYSILDWSTFPRVTYIVYFRYVFSFSLHVLGCFTCL